jgi:hypothetical protein
MWWLLDRRDPQSLACVGQNAVTILLRDFVLIECGADYMTRPPEHVSDDIRAIAQCLFCRYLSARGHPSLSCAAALRMAVITLDTA